jgi:biotin transport system substrate-specific component
MNRLAMSRTLSAETLIDVLGSRRQSRELAFATRAVAVLFVTALTAAAAQVSVSIPFTEVPFTLQPMVVLMGGLALGPRLGATAQILYLAAGLAGLPVFAISPVLPMGVGRLLGPTGGYLMSYPIAAFVAGALAARGFDRRYLTSVVAMLAGLAVIYAFGTLWLGFVARTVAGGAPIGLQAALATGVYPFVLADLLKLAFAAGVIPGLWKLVR